MTLALVVERFCIGAITTCFNDIPTVVVACQITLTAQWPCALSIGKKMKPFTDNSVVSLLVNSRGDNPPPSQQQQQQQQILHIRKLKKQHSLTLSKIASYIVQL